MKLAELNQLKKGCPVRISEGNGWYREAKFIRVVNVTSFGKMTFADIVKCDFDMNNGRKKKEVVVDVIDDNGRKQTRYVSPRKVYRKEV